MTKLIFEQVIAKLGIPSTLVTDNGTNFVSNLFKELYKMLGIRKITTSPYHPEANGALERSHRPLAEYLRTVVKEDATNWDEWLYHAMHIYNNNVHSATKQTPTRILFGFDIDLPTNIKRKPGPLYNHDDYPRVLKYQLQRMHQLVNETQKREKEKSKKYYDRNAKERVFKVGEKVWLRNQNRKNKFSPVWEGPYEIVSLPNNVNVKLCIKGKEKVYHKNLIKQFYENNNLGTN